MTQVGATTLMKMLKEVECPNHKEESKSMTDEEKSKIKFYKPMFLDAIACHLGNGA